MVVHNAIGMNWVCVLNTAYNKNVSCLTLNCAIVQLLGLCSMFYYCAGGAAYGETYWIFVLILEWTVWAELLSLDIRLLNWQEYRNTTFGWAHKNINNWYIIWIRYISILYLYNLWLKQLFFRESFGACIFYGKKQVFRKFSTNSVLSNSGNTQNLIRFHKRSCFHPYDVKDYVTSEYYLNWGKEKLF